MESGIQLAKFNCVVKIKYLLNGYLIEFSLSLVQWSLYKYKYLWGVVGCGGQGPGFKSPKESFTHTHIYIYIYIYF